MTEQEHKNLERRVKDNKYLTRYETDYIVDALEEVQQYRAIGTPEECREAVEKHIPKKITHQGCFDNKGVWHTWNGINGVPYDLCPNCKTNLCTDGVFGRDKKIMKYCENCGQKLDWSDNMKN